MAKLSLVLAVTIGFGLGIGAAPALRAQSKLPAYVVSEIELANPDAYAKEYVPLANKALANSGQKRLASGGRTIALAGAAPAQRVVISMFDSLEQAQRAYTSPEYLEARKVGDKYGKLRIFAVEASGP